MKLSELPIGTCWVCANKSRELGVFLKEWEILFFRDSFPVEFRPDAPVTGVTLQFIPVELV